MNFSKATMELSCQRGSKETPRKRPGGGLPAAHALRLPLALVMVTVGNKGTGVGPISQPLFPQALPARTPQTERQELGWLMFMWKLCLPVQ